MRIEQLVQLSPSMISFDIELDISDLTLEPEKLGPPTPVPPAAEQTAQ